MRIEEKPAFEVCGRKVWISGQNNEEFGEFWNESHENGLVERLKGFGTGKITNSGVFGVSRVEKYPDNRQFFFYIAAEHTGEDDLEDFTVPACKWAIFEGAGELPMSLVNAEMEAFMKWLPSSGYVHAHAPELEVYPVSGAEVEFWLPVEEKK